MIIDESLTPEEQLAIIKKEFGKQHLYLNAYNVNMLVRKIGSSYFAEGLIKDIDYSTVGNVDNYKYVALHCTWNSELGTRLDFYQLHAVIDSCECITFRTDSELQTLDQALDALREMEKIYKENENDRAAYVI